SEFAASCAPAAPAQCSRLPTLTASALESFLHRVYFCTEYSASTEVVMSGIETEVVIAGAGPTGLALACELALAGVETLVLEKLPHRLRQVKGGALQPRTSELLEMRGLLEPMQRRALPREAV